MHPIQKKARRRQFHFQYLRTLSVTSKAIVISLDEVIGPFPAPIQVSFSFDGLEYGAHFTSNTPGNTDSKEQPNENVEYGIPYTWQHTTWQYVQLFKSLNLLT